MTDGKDAEPSPEEVAAAREFPELVVLARRVLRLRRAQNELKAREGTTLALLEREFTLRKELKGVAVTEGSVRGVVRQREEREWAEVPLRRLRKVLGIRARHYYSTRTTIRYAELAKLSLPSQEKLGLKLVATTKSLAVFLKDPSNPSERNPSSGSGSI